MGGDLIKSDTTHRKRNKKKAGNSTSMAFCSATHFPAGIDEMNNGEITTADMDELL